MIVLFNKPYGVLCQFTDTQGRPTLADYIKTPNVYAAGRLDLDSEGLLVLTDDRILAHRLTDPQHKEAKRYLVQIEGVPTERQLDQLRRGVRLNDGMTLPAEVRLLAKSPGWLWPRNPPIRMRKQLATHWLEIDLREGRNRQVRRMTAAVGLPTLRLVRLRCAEFELGNLASGAIRHL